MKSFEAWYSDTVNYLSIQQQEEKKEASKIPEVMPGEKYIGVFMDQHYILTSDVCNPHKMFSITPELPDVAEILFICDTLSISEGIYALYSPAYSWIGFGYNRSDKAYCALTHGHPYQYLYLKRIPV